MRSRLVGALGIVLAIAAVLLCWPVGQPGPVPAARPAVSQVAGSGKGAAARPSVEPLPARTDARQGSLFRITDGSSMIVGARIGRWPGGDLSELSEQALADSSDWLASTDDSGEAVVQALVAGSAKGVAVWHRDYRPALVTQIEPNCVHEVVLTRDAPVEVLVRLAGQPVEGFVVSASRQAVTDVVAPALPGHHARHIFLVGSQSTTAAIGTTDQGGRAVLRGLAPGRHLLDVNISDLPYQVTNYTDCLVVEAPGRVVIELAEFRCIVAKPIGDTPCLTRAIQGKGSPFTFSSDVPTLRAIEVAQRGLRQRFPDCLVHVGVPLPGASSQADLHLFGPITGWSKHGVTLRSLMSISQPEEVWLDVAVASQSASIVAELCDDGGRAIEHEGASLAFAWKHDDVLFTRLAKPGERVVSPVGGYSVRPAGELPPNCFPLQERSALPGENRLAIPVDATLKRYAVVVELPWGAAPSEFGLSLAWNEASAPGVRRTSSMITCRGGRHTFWTSSKSIPFTVHVKGFKSVTGLIEPGAGKSEQGVGVFRVPVSHLIDL
jgi:hypothetical protein